MEWIKVQSQPLPDKEVLCVNVKGFYLIGYVNQDKLGDYTPGTFSAENDGEILPKVIAWMPLPSPPES